MTFYINSNRAYVFLTLQNITVFCKVNIYLSTQLLFSLFFFCFCSVFLYSHIICFSGDCWWQIVYFSLKYIYTSLLKKNVAEHKPSTGAHSCLWVLLSCHTTVFQMSLFLLRGQLPTFLLFLHFYYIFHFVIPFLSFFKILKIFFSSGYTV